MFGAKRRRTRELAHEILAPLGKDLKDLTEAGRTGNSRASFEREMRRIVDRDQDQALYDSQTGWEPPAR